jgi:hypothetical protein
MTETLGLAALIVAGSVTAFAVSIRLGILLGRRLDRAIESRTTEDPEPPPSDGALGSIAPGNFGQQENRGD